MFLYLTAAGSFAATDDGTATDDVAAADDGTATDDDAAADDVTAANDAGYERAACTVSNIQC